MLRDQSVAVTQKLISIQSGMKEIKKIIKIG